MNKIEPAPACRELLSVNILSGFSSMQDNTGILSNYYQRILFIIVKVMNQDHNIQVLSS